MTTSMRAAMTAMRSEVPSSDVFPNSAESSAMKITRSAVSAAVAAKRATAGVATAAQEPHSPCDIPVSFLFFIFVFFFYFLLGKTFVFNIYCMRQFRCILFNEKLHETNYFQDTDTCQHAHKYRACLLAQKPFY